MVQRGREAARQRHNIHCSEKVVRESRFQRSRSHIFFFLKSREGPKNKHIFFQLDIVGCCCGVTHLLRRSGIFLASLGRPRVRLARWLRGSTAAGLSGLRRLHRLRGGRYLSACWTIGGGLLGRSISPLVSWGCGCGVRRSLRNDGGRRHGGDAARFPPPWFDSVVGGAGGVVEGALRAAEWALRWLLCPSCGGRTNGSRGDEIPATESQVSPAVGIARPRAEGRHAGWLTGDWFPAGCVR